MAKSKLPWIGPRLIVVLLMAYSLATPGMGVSDPDNVDAIFGAKATELVTGKSLRSEKIAAIHVFVRDSIRQVETQYG
ncbi:MAG: hypothetical protein PHW60_05550 [Kiritimatiellae bacterium]|nr:hypothetical protein [Kiritimatiellia bacterium]